MVQKGESFKEHKGEEEDKTKSFFWKRIGKVGGTCGRKPHILF
jgi:hypothetical protein